jgi:hypothetical protein
MKLKNEILFEILEDSMRIWDHLNEAIFFLEHNCPCLVLDEQSKKNIIINSKSCKENIDNIIKLTKLLDNHNININKKLDLEMEKNNE